MKYILLLLLIQCAHASAAPLLAIDDMRATAVYWTKKTENGDIPLKSPAELEEINNEIQNADLGISNLATYPQTLSADSIRAKIKEAFLLGGFDETLPALYQNLRPLMAADYAGVLYNASPDLPEISPITYAVTVRRTNLRHLPETRGWFEHPTDIHYDALQATAVDPAEPALILAESRDKKYLFLQTRTYAGWAKKEDLARTDRQHFLRYQSPTEYLTVTVPKKRISLQGETLLFQMGARLPLIGDQDTPQEERKPIAPTRAVTRNLLIENPAARHPKKQTTPTENQPTNTRAKTIASYRILLPYAENGSLRETTLQIEADNTVHKGNLSPTPNQIIAQSIKYRGQIYGWGGLEESVDCSSFVANIYRAIGIDLPRDADQQERAMPQTISLRGKSLEERKQILRTMPPGALLFTPTHVALYLGIDAENEPIVIQSVSSAYQHTGGISKKLYPRRVLISNLVYDNAAGDPWLLGVTSIGAI